MNGYKCFYNGKTEDVEATSSYQAQLLAHSRFCEMFPRRKVKKYEITVILCEKDGEQVTHSTSTI